ncbi:MAG: hypothetical protein HY660_01185 [Armatimonadetes bacterium]|nr:hypothetical protein [Armatimonadota bacterium]
MAAFSEPSSVSPARTVEELRRALELLDVELEYVDTLYWLNYWWVYGGQGGDLDAAEAMRAGLLRRPGLWELLEEWSAHDLDPLLRRWVEVWRREIGLARITAHPDVLRQKNEILRAIIRLRPVVRGREISPEAARTILATEPDHSLRREAWEGLARLGGTVAGTTQALMRTRNDLAREAGFRAYPDFALAPESLTVEEVRGVIAALERGTRDAYRAALARAAQASDIEDPQPWDGAFIVGAGETPFRALFTPERMLPLAYKTFRRLGLAEAAATIDVVTAEIPYHGICIAIRVPEDIRIYLAPRHGFPACSTVFHEFGHAFHWAGAAQKRHTFNYERGPITEMMAQTMALFARHEGWIVDVAGADARTAADWGRWLRLWYGYYLREYMMHVTFEYGVFDDPDRDLDALSADATARYVGVAALPSSGWAFTAFLANYPVYRQNYILADVVAAANHTRLGEITPRPWSDPEAVEAIRASYWAPGSTLSWREKARRFTGAELDPAELTRFLTRE